MWSVVVVLSTVQAEFGVDRAAALPSTLTMLGFAVGGLSTTPWQFALAHGVLVGALGRSVACGPLMADVSRWFWRRRWSAESTRSAGARRGPASACSAASPCCRSRCSCAAGPPAVTTLSPAAMQALLVVAGLACCVAMAMPQVHIVARCSGLGYGIARGAPMLSLMLGFGIVSRVGLRRRPDRRPRDAAGRCAAAGGGTRALSRVRRPDLALRDLGPVRSVPGRHRAGLRDHRARGPPGRGGRGADRCGTDGDARRHGAGRLAHGGDLRRHRLLPCGVRQRVGLERRQRGDRAVADPLPSRAHEAGRASRAPESRAACQSRAPCASYA